MDTPYSQSGQDPTQQQGLLQILQQIQAIQNRPLIPDNPLSQLGAALQGASAGFAGQPNPAVAQAMAARQQQLSGLSQTAGVLGQIGTIKQQEATLAETRRARAVQEKAEERHAKTEERAQEDASLKISDAAWKRAMEIGDPNMAAVSYRELSKKLPGYFPPMSEGKIKSLAEDAIGRETFKKNQVGMATAAYLGLPTYLGKPIPQDVAGMPKRALALLAGKTETQLAHGSLDEWQVAIRKKVAQVGFDNLSAEERADFLALEGRGASDAMKAAIANIEDDIAAHGKVQKPLGQYFRIARERADLSQPVKDILKSHGIDVVKATSEQITAARDQHRNELVVDSASKNIKVKAVHEMNARAGGKKNLHPEFKHLPDDFVKQLAVGDENALMQLLGALGVTMKPQAAAPSAGGASGPVLKNGKTLEQAIQDGMGGGASRAEAEAEILRLRKAGKL